MYGCLYSFISRAPFLLWVHLICKGYWVNGRQDHWHLSVVIACPCLGPASPRTTGMLVTASSYSDRGNSTYCCCRAALLRYYYSAGSAYTAAPAAPVGCRILSSTVILQDCALLKATGVVLSLQVATASYLPDLWQHCSVSSADCLY